MKSFLSRFPFLEASASAEITRPTYRVRRAVTAQATLTKRGQRFVDVCRLSQPGLVVDGTGHGNPETGG